MTHGIEALTDAGLPKKTLVGVVGGAASGKDTVAEFFTHFGYVHVSSSDLLREEIARRGQVTSRELQTAVANELRKENGANYWVDLSIAKLGTQATKGVISGLYSPGEGEYLVKEHGGVLVSVVAGDQDDTRARFERLRARSSGARDQMSYEEFLTAHQRETSGAANDETNLTKLHSMANFVVHNTADLEFLHTQTATIIETIERGV